MRVKLPLFLLAACSSLAFSTAAAPGQTGPGVDGMIRSAIGVTRSGTPIPCFLTEDDLDPDTKKFRVLLIGGLDGENESTQAVMKALEASRDDQSIALSVVPDVLPDESGAAAPGPLAFPPEGNAYNQAENDIAHYLWRWIGNHAPDLVIIAAPADNPSAISLATALSETSPSGVGAIPALISPTEPTAAIPEAAARKSSPARREIQRRVARTPIEIANELARVYGQRMDPVMYIPALAMVGRMRLGELTGDPNPQRDAEKICAPFYTGEKESMPPKGNGSTISGHLVFSELARRTDDHGWTALAKKAADYGFDENGHPKESMPFHSEMSDSVFMGCAILAETGALTGNEKYFEQCLRHLRFMEKLCLREDGIYRHSPLHESAWGRGNGFPALGMALSLSALPEDSAEFAAFLQSYRNHLGALRTHQDPTGAWHQVIDHGESYREFTSTCMITFAMVRGLRRGWLDPTEWQPVVDRAWTAIKSRVGSDGYLVDVCTGTGKQKSLRDYFDRTAILGPDERGGAMALLVSTEIAFWERERKR